MTERFKKDYGAYEGVDTSILKHIPEVSSYDNNYFIGLKREGRVRHDLLFADGNDDYQVDWYIVNGGSATYIGYEFVEEGVLNFIVIMCRECHNKYDNNREFRQKQTLLYERVKSFDELAANRYFDL